MTNARALPEYAAVRHILGSPQIAGRAARYVGEDDFDWRGLLAEAQTMSGGERILIRIAYDLWEAKGTVGVWEIPRGLDRRSFQRVIDALSICRGDLPASSELWRDAA